MKTILHPSLWLDEESTSQIGAGSQEAELSGKLTAEQLALIYQKKWFKMFVPTSMGGLGYSLSEVLRTEEGLAWVDGSTAWVVTLCSGAGWFAGFIDPKVIGALCRDEKFCMAGSGAATGTAEITSHGYVIEGFWRYASGSLHATAFTANCLVRKNGQQLLNSDGSPRVAAFVLKESEVQVHRSWNAMGMKATGSHSFEVKGIEVPTDRCFVIDPASAVLSDPIYRYPFLQLAETTLSVNISGLAMRFVDLAENLFIEKGLIKDTPTYEQVRQARNVLNECRAAFFDKADQSSELLSLKDKIPGDLLKDISEAGHLVVHTSRMCVNDLYPLCGLRAAAVDTEINRVWRNIHTAAQHSLFIK